jgi:glyoxylase-like metal-dependent hydrolase (beta-lactamase superfamily II)
MNPADHFLWEAELGDAPFDALSDGDRFPVAGVELVAMHTPGHTPGSTSLLVDALGAVFTGDTLFPGGPGATRWPYSSFDGILASIEARLFALPDDTVVHPGHGDSTTIGAERPRLREWRARGW